MKLAILFWFYKSPVVCENHLRLLRKYNRDIKIYGLYGGERKKMDLYKKRFGKYLNNFYCSPPRSTHWKWIHGDLMIRDWYKKCGRRLDWDSVVVIQWDMLVFESIKKLFSGIKEGEIFFSGLRKLDSTLEERWTWTKPKKGRWNYLKFKRHIKSNYGYGKRTLPCCLFIMEIFPRTFLNKYLAVKNPGVGMLEYKVPTYAEIFRIPVYKKDMGVWWCDESSQGRALTACCNEINTGFIKSELKKKNGWRAFHPYFKVWK